MSRYLALILLVMSLLTSDGHAVSGRDEELFFLGAKAFEDHFYTLAEEKLRQLVKWYPQSPRGIEAHLLLGQVALHFGLFQKALEELEWVWHTLAPNDFIADGLYWTAEVYLKGKDFSRAKVFYRRVLKEYPDSNFIRYALYGVANCEQLQGNWKEALGSYGEFLKRFSTGDLWIDVRIGLAENLYHLERYPESSAVLSELLVMKGTTPFQKGKALFVYGQLHYAQKEYKEAVSLITSHVEQGDMQKELLVSYYPLGWAYLRLEEYEKALETFNHFTETAEKNTLMEGAIYGSGLTFVKLGKYQEAIDRFSLLIEKYPESEWSDDAFLGKADALYGQGKFKSAIDFYSACIQRFPASGLLDEARYNLGWAYTQAHLMEEAIHTFQELAEISKDPVLKVSSLCRIGDLYLDQKNYKQSSEVFDIVLKEYPESPYAEYAQYQLGVALSGMGEYGAAQLAFESLLLHFPQSRYRDQGQFQLAWMAIQKGEYQRALREFQSLAQLTQQTDLKKEAQFQIATLTANLGQYEEAIEAFHQLRKENPGSEIVLKAQYQIGWCFYKLGKEKKALEEFRDLLHHYPTIDLAADIQFWFGEYYYNQGKFELARENFKMVVESFPKHELADDALYQIGRCFATEKKFEEALKVLSALLQEYPKTNLVPEILVRMGDFYLKLERREGALEKYQTASIRFRNHSFGKLAAFRLGQLYSEQGEWYNAIRYFKQALGLADPALNAEIQFRLAKALQQTGDQEKAIEEFLEISYRYPEPEVEQWVRKAWMEVAQSFEAQNRWEEATLAYSKLLDKGNSEETQWAKVRLEWISKKKRK